jgi:hypothetical protein
LHCAALSVLCRFVEDNWESPVLGAWGLGWEVWLDGMEVTQFTYFQQVRRPCVGSAEPVLPWYDNLSGGKHLQLDVVAWPADAVDGVLMCCQNKSRGGL